MQRLFDVRLIRPSSLRHLALFSLSSFFVFTHSFGANDATILPAKCHSRVYHRRKDDLERRIFRDTKENVSRRSGLIIRFRGAKREDERRLC